MVFFILSANDVFIKYSNFIEKKCEQEVFPPTTWSSSKFTANWNMVLFFSHQNVDLIQSQTHETSYLRLTLYQKLHNALKMLYNSIWSTCMDYCSLLGMLCSIFSITIVSRFPTKKKIHEKCRIEKKIKKGYEWVGWLILLNQFYFTCEFELKCKHVSEDLPVPVCKSFKRLIDINVFVRGSEKQTKTLSLVSFTNNSRR